ncbi:MAG: zinc ribbon domain-containing protein [Deltaproteobacteria bacterium]|nr:zinc ribbon domain-containing protein [Deltaproteobacteria bacterium]MBW2660570.1 zinc ribbon domain-containing protein [Deltaproteobacteria bacterium]
MPLFDFLCLDCGKQSEILITDSGDTGMGPSLRLTHVVN